MKKEKSGRIIRGLSLTFLVLWMLGSLISCKKQEAGRQLSGKSQTIFIEKTPSPPYQTNLRNEENSFEINICQDSEIKSNAEIYMYVNEISQQGITYTMVNHSLYMIRYGLEYDLQRIVDEEWVSELEGLKGSYYSAKKPITLSQDRRYL